MATNRQSQKCLLCWLWIEKRAFEWQQLTRLDSAAFGQSSRAAAMAMWMLSQSKSSAMATAAIVVVVVLAFRCILACNLQCTCRNVSALHSLAMAWQTMSRVAAVSWFWFCCCCCWSLRTTYRETYKIQAKIALAILYVARIEAMSFAMKKSSVYTKTNIHTNISKPNRPLLHGFHLLPTYQNWACH